MRHRAFDDDDEGDEGDGFISGTPAKPRPMGKSDLIVTLKKALSNPMVIAGIVIVMLMYLRPWGGTAAAVQGLAVVPDPGTSTASRMAANDDVVVVDATARSTLVNSGGGDDDDDNDGGGRVVQTRRATASGGKSESEDVVVVDSAAAQAVRVGGEGGASRSSSDDDDAPTRTVTTATSGDMTTTIHVTDEFGEPSPPPPPLPPRQKPADVKKLESSLGRLEAAMKQRVAPSGEELTNMLAKVEELMRTARSDDVTFDQRQRLAAVEKIINKAHKGSKLAQKLAEGESLLRTGGAPEELRNKMKEIEVSIREAGPQINNHPHIKEQLEKQLDEIDKRLEERKAADERRKEEEREERERQVRNDPVRRDRERTRQAAERKEDINGAPKSRPDAPEEDETQKLAKKIERMVREGGDDLVITALKEKLGRMGGNIKEASQPIEAVAKRVAGDNYTSVDDGTDPDEIVVGRRRKLPRGSGRIRGIFRGGASVGGKGEDEEVEDTTPSKGRSKADDDDDDEEEEVIIVKRPKKKRDKSVKVT